MSKEEPGARLVPYGFSPDCSFSFENIEINGLIVSNWKQENEHFNHFRFKETQAQLDAGFLSIMAVIQK